MCAAQSEYLTGSIIPSSSNRSSSASTLALSENGTGLDLWKIGEVPGSTCILAFTPSTVPSSFLKTSLVGLYFENMLPVQFEQFLPSNEGPFPFLITNGSFND